LPVLLARVDDRLIHGQVTLGLGSILNPDAYVVIDDQLASSLEARALLESSASPSEAYVTTRGGVSDLIGGSSLAGKKMLLLAKSPQDFLEILDEEVEFEELNLGGMHWSEGKSRYMDYLYMDDRDVEVLTELAGRGITVYAKDVPGGTRVELEELLRRKGE
jgi:PTS system mannose-specific IIB component